MDVNKKFDDYYLFSCMKNVAFLHKSSIFLLPVSCAEFALLHPPEKHALFQAFPPAEKIKVLTFS